MSVGRYFPLLCAWDGHCWSLWLDGHGMLDGDSLANGSALPTLPKLPSSQAACHTLVLGDLRHLIAREGLVLVPPRPYAMIASVKGMCRLNILYQKRIERYKSLDDGVGVLKGKDSDNWRALPSSLHLGIFILAPNRASMGFRTKSWPSWDGVQEDYVTDDVLVRLICHSNHYLLIDQKHCWHNNCLV